MYQTCKMHFACVNMTSLGCSEPWLVPDTGGLHHLNGLLSIITVSMTLAKTQSRLLIQGVWAAACITGHNTD